MFVLISFIYVTLIGFNYEKNNYFVYQEISALDSISNTSSTITNIKTFQETETKSSITSDILFKEKENENHRFNFILLNTTNISDCSAASDTIYRTIIKGIINGNNDNTNDYDDDSAMNIEEIVNNSSSNITSFQDNDDTLITNICPFVKIISPISYGMFKKEVTNTSESNFIQNEVNDTTTTSEKSILNSKIFDEKGYLIADTTIDKQLSYELVDPLNQEKKIKVNLDFAEHTQSNNYNINSPRIELIRQNINGSIDMDAAKNQLIIWNGDIKDYFQEPKGKYSNETYITITFNTGHHSSDAPDNERRALGVLFDVSNSSKPYLLEYKNKNKYTKFTIDDLYELAGKDFVFHSTDNQNKGHFINNLIDKDNIVFKVKTFLTPDGQRQISTFIDDGSGKEIPYWSLKNVSKLYQHDNIKDKESFIETLYQGSGYTLVRSDNIDTRIKSLKSLLMTS